MSVKKQWERAVPDSENSKQTQQKRILNCLKISDLEHEEQLKNQNKKLGKTSHQK